MNSQKNVKNPSSIATCIISPQYRRRVRQVLQLPTGPAGDHQNRCPPTLHGDVYQLTNIKRMELLFNHPLLISEQKLSELLTEMLRLCPRGSEQQRHVYLRLYLVDDEDVMLVSPIILACDTRI
jgi:hypothetical protein